MLKRHCNIIFYFIATFLISSTVFQSEASAQVVVAPVDVFVNPQNQFGTFHVINNSSQSREVTVDFIFGYPQSNDQGELTMVYGDSLQASQYSLASYMRGFPRNFVVDAGSRQTVRLTARLPQNKPEGMYWARIRTSSVPESEPISTQTSDNAVNAQISLRFVQVTKAFYKKGNPATSIRVNSVSAQQQDSTTTIQADMTRTGNSIFVGSVDITVQDGSGSNVIEENRTFELYFNEVRNFTINTSDLNPGQYTAKLKFQTTRPGTPKDFLPSMEPVTRNVTLSIR